MNFIIKRLRILFNYDTMKGLAPWIILFIITFSIERHYSYVLTSIDKTVSNLETGTMYLMKISNKGCPSQIVKFRSHERKISYYRTIRARGGQVFKLTENGYQIDDKKFEMDMDWQTTAKTELGLKSEITIKDSHYLFINSDFDTSNKYKTSKYNKWAFDIVSRDQVQAVVTHILFSRDFSRIGELVGPKNSDCPLPST